MSYPVPKLHIPEVRSTNTWMLDALSQGNELPDQFVVYTFRQTAGRGQVGNSWESEPDSNIAMSMLLCPEFLPIAEQFILSQLCSLAIVEALCALALRKGVDPESLHLCIKWPNDIYAGDLKLGGILIENRLMGSKLKHCVLGIGINVRQERWVGSAPNPVSLRLLGLDAAPDEVLEAVSTRISALYQQLRDNAQQSAVAIRRDYLSCLYRKQGYFPYFDPERNESFEAKIVAIDPQGPLVLETAKGEERRYWFKEVRFVLPCGVTKE